MTAFRIKIFTSPLLLMAADYLTNSIVFSALWQPAAIGILFALVSYLFEQITLRRGSLWISTILDFLLAALIIYTSQFFLKETRISLVGAIFAAAVLSAFEYIVHVYLIRIGQVGR
jgi:hypothetical protein